VLRSIENGEEEAAQLATLLAFVETFVFNKVYHEPFDCPAVHFLAVLGIDEENDRLRTGNDYSYRVAGLVYCFRVFALEAVLPARQRAAQGPDEFEAFLEQRKQHLTDGSIYDEHGDQSSGVRQVSRDESRQCWRDLLGDRGQGDAPSRHAQRHGNRVVSSQTGLPRFGLFV
jgi:hypothetical protein